HRDLAQFCFMGLASKARRRSASCVTRSKQFSHGRKEYLMGIKIQDVAYVRFSAPDLDEMEAFLVDFGMARAVRTSDTLYMRGLDEDSFLHVTHRGEPGFLAAGFEAASMQDLDTLAREEKVSLDSLDGPGGGSVVRL